MKKILLVSTLVLGSLIALTGQDRYGHLNFGNLIAVMPEAIQANDSLEIMQATMVARGEAMAAQFQRDASAFIKDVQSGTLTPVQQQERQAALEKRQVEIQNFEQEIVQTMGATRNQMLEPIIARAQQAIDDVAKENGYVMVFDTSVFNAVMFADESEDLMDMVKAKLGIE
ncbi:MAG: OmpH family outer membrane protein [Bacteroidota bacterium]